MKLIVATLLLVLCEIQCSYSQSQSNLYDTEELRVVDDADLRTRLFINTHFDRSWMPFTMGWNFGDLRTRHGNDVFDIGLIDVGDQNPGIKFDRHASTMRYILVNEPNNNDGATEMFGTTGNGQYSRADFELTQDVNGRPTKETGSNTGAIHGFGTKEIGSVNGKYLELRTQNYTAPPKKLFGNTNSMVLYSFDATFDSKGSQCVTYNGNQQTVTVDDATRNGQMMMLGLLMRVAADNTSIPADGSANDDVVLTIVVRRQTRLSVDDNQLVVEDENDDDLYLGFSAVPTLTTNPVIRTVGVDPPPRLLDRVVTTSGIVSWDNKFTQTTNGPGKYLNMPLAYATATTNLVGREDIWCDMRDVREETRNVYTKMEITVGMLRKLLNGGSGPSRWTTFQGLIVFNPVNEISDDEYLTKDMVTGVGIVNNLNEPLRPNRSYSRGSTWTQNGGQWTNDRPLSVCNLNVEVTYHGQFDVDLDYLSMATPNGNAIMRDMHRQQLVNDIKVATSTSEMQTQQRIYGIRSIEERGEEHWYTQRYLNTLLAGRVLTEMFYYPFDAYRHVAYDHVSSQYKVPLVAWNGGNTSRTEPNTPVPYLLVGAADQFNGPYASQNSYKTFRLASGIAGTLWSDFNNGVNGYSNTFMELGASFDERLKKVSEYELGFDCQTETRIENLSAINLNYWENHEAFETEDGDGDPDNDAPRHCESTASDDVINWPHAARSERSMHQYGQSPGSSDWMFGDVRWFEQVWMGTALMVHGEKNVVNEQRRFVVDRYGDQSRAMTAEELRLRFWLPTILGADGIMMYQGDNGVIMNSAASKTIFCSPFNLQDEIDMVQEDPPPGGGTPLTLSANDLREKYLNDDYGADYPTYSATPEQFTCNVEGADVTFTCDGYLPNAVRAQFPNGWTHWNTGDIYLGRVEEKLWVDKAQYDFEAVQRDANPVATFRPLSHVQRVAEDGTIVTNPPEVEKVYFGFKSLRTELLRYTDWLARETDEHVLTQGETTKVKDLLNLLDLKSWAQLGYKDQRNWQASSSTTDPLSSWIDVSRVRTRHPYREFNARADYEPQDSTFADITLLQRREDESPDAPLVNDFYIGVVNRRTNPVYIRRPQSGQPPTEEISFSSTQEFLALVAAETNGHRLYDQIGARSIVLPFDYQYSSGEGAKLIRVTEVGLSDASDGGIQTMYQYPIGSPTTSLTRALIDTLVDARGTLEINLLPGEGKLFRVRLLDASVDAARGYLAFNTQTKVVVANEQIMVGSTLQQTEKLRYHMVYTRQPENENVWRVYYRRSVAMSRDELPDVAGATWEPEFELGDQFEVKVNVPDEGRRTLDQSNQHWLEDHYLDNPPVTKITNVLTGTDGVIEMHAAFPSIALGKGKYAILNNGLVTGGATKQRVHITYGQAVNRFEGGVKNEMHVIEVQFDDFHTPPPILPVPRSLSLIAVADNFDRFNVDDLASWGTPTNGIGKQAVPFFTQLDGMHDYSDRIFTAWSVRSNVGITSTLRSVQSVFPMPVEQDYLDDGEWQTIIMTQGGDNAQYPSLTPLSNPVNGEFATASLVWQEASVGNNEELVDGTSIMYTRIFEDNQGGLSRHNYGIPACVSMHYGNIGPLPAMLPQVFPLVDCGVDPPPFINHVARISAVVAGADNLYPTVVRSAYDKPAMTLSFIDQDPPGHQLDISFEFEEVTWQNIEPEMSQTRIHRRYFIMQQEILPGPALVPTPGRDLRFWWMGSTAWAPNGHYVAPVLALGSYREGVQEYRISASTTIPPEYYDPIYDDLILTGNISDSSMFSAFGIFQGNIHLNNPRGRLPWDEWPVSGPSSSIEQVPLRFVPIPAHTGSIALSHYWSVAEGQWPHISHEYSSSSYPQRHTKQNLRRIAQTDDPNSAIPMITSSAEYLYKSPSRPNATTYQGVATSSGTIALRAGGSNGEHLLLHHIEGYGRESSLDVMLSSLSVPVTDISTDWMSRDALSHFDIDSYEDLRKDIELYIDEQNWEGELVRSVRINLPKMAAARGSKHGFAEYRIVNADNAHFYRIRLHMNEAGVFYEHTSLQSESDRESKGKQAEHQQWVVNLDGDYALTEDQISSINVYPNPASHSAVAVVQHEHTCQEAELIVSDVLGSTVAKMHFHENAVELDTSTLAAGMYTVKVMCGSVLVCTTTMLIEK